MLQTYGLVCDRYVQLPSGYSWAPITEEYPFGKMQGIFIGISNKPDDKTKKRNQESVQKAIAKYNSIKDIYNDKKRVYLRNAIDYYNRH